MDDLGGEEKVKLALLSGMAKNGASEGTLLASLAEMNGANLIPLWEKGGGKVMVKVDRVYSVGPDGMNPGCTLVVFDHGGWDAKRLTIDMEVHKVVERLRSAGWEH